MLLLTMNEQVETILGLTRLQELELFNEKWKWLKSGLDAKNNHPIVYKKYETSFFVRLINQDQITESVITGHIIDHPPMMDMQWRYEDRIVENSQGGTTHLKGWHLE